MIVEARRIVGRGLTGDHELLQSVMEGRVIGRQEYYPDAVTPTRVIEDNGDEIHLMQLVDRYRGARVRITIERLD
jgi:hypothetical protein